MMKYVILTIMLIVSPCYGALLDWDAVSWTAGSLSQSYDVDPLNAGNDVTVTITDSSGGLRAGSPSINQVKTGGLIPVESSLNLNVNFGNRNNFLTVTVSFNYAQGVDVTGFMLFDIDKDSANRYVTQIRNIQAMDLNDSAVAGNVSGLGSSVTPTGGGLTQTLYGNATAGDSTARGNAAIDFSGTTIKQFSFDFGNKATGTPISQNNPTAQSISFHDIKFAPVPEVGVFVCLLIVCVILVSHHIYSRWRNAIRKV